MHIQDQSSCSWLRINRRLHEPCNCIYNISFDLLFSAENAQKLDFVNWFFFLQVMGWAYAKGDHITKEHILVYWLAPVEATLVAVWIFNLLFQMGINEKAKKKTEQQEATCVIELLFSNQLNRRNLKLVIELVQNILLGVLNLTLPVTNNQFNEDPAQIYNKDDYFTLSSQERGLIYLEFLQKGETFVNIRVLSLFVGCMKSAGQRLSLSIKHANRATNYF